MLAVLLCGGLGSGKTTLLLALAEQLGKEGMRIGILENDFGAMPVDAPTLRSRGYSVEDVRSGCICCDLQTQLPNALENLRADFEPDILLIEPSGVAAPGILRNHLEGLLDFSDSLVSIYLIDLVKYWENGASLSQFFIQASNSADLVLGTKTSGQTELAMAALTQELSNNGCHTPVAASEVAQNWGWDEIVSLSHLIGVPSLRGFDNSAQSEPLEISTYARTITLVWEPSADSYDAMEELKEVVNRIRRGVGDIDDLKIGTVKMMTPEGCGTIIGVSDSLSPVTVNAGAEWETPPVSITLNVLAFGRGDFRDLVETALNEADLLKEWNQSNAIRGSDRTMVSPGLRL